MHIERVLAAVAPGEVAYALDGTIAAERVEIPAEMRGTAVLFAADAVDCFVRFGDAAVVVDVAARSSLVAEVLAEDGTEPQLFLPSGGSLRFFLPEAFTHMSLVMSAASGALRFGPWRPA